jgi:plasmid maintenance system killer protein
MKITFQSKKLALELTHSRALLKRYGERAKKINQRMNELSAAESLAVIQKMPAIKCHELIGERKGQLAVRISGNYRLIFEPSNDPLLRKPDGGLMWDSITEIRIIEIEDYH